MATTFFTVFPSQTCVSFHTFSPHLQYCHCGAKKNPSCLSQFALILWHITIAAGVGSVMKQHHSPDESCGEIHGDCWRHCLFLGAARFLEQKRCRLFWTDSKREGSVTVCSKNVNHSLLKKMPTVTTSSKLRAISIALTTVHLRFYTKMFLTITLTITPTSSHFMLQPLSWQYDQLQNPQKSSNNAVYSKRRRVNKVIITCSSDLHFRQEHFLTQTAYHIDS